MKEYWYKSPDGIKFNIWKGADGWFIDIHKNNEITTESGFFLKKQAENFIEKFYSAKKITKKS